MFDTTCSNQFVWQKGKLIELMPAERLYTYCSSCGVVCWEEHCVECGQPYCFKTCSMYERAFDGKCKRFKCGIVPLTVGGMCAYGCSFKKWGKLEGVFTGRVWSKSFLHRFVAIDRHLSSFVRGINRIMAFVPGRIGAITVYRRLKKWAFDYLPGKRDCLINGLVMQVWADQPVKLHFSVLKEDRTVYDDVISLARGWNDWTASFPSVGKGTRFLLFSTESDEFALVFSCLELIDGGGAWSEKGEGRKSAMPAKFVKCLAWDLDNTLWRGILVEDGADKLVLNPDAVDLIKTLDQRGIINTILSKNDYEAAWKVLERFGLAEYFVFPTINWLPKSSNLEAVAKTINIGLDTFAFVDDSPFERGEVGEKLPMVRVFKNTEISGLAVRPEFNPPVSGEGTKRRLSYQKEMQRVAAAQAFAGDYSAFLKSCEIELTLFPLKGADASVYDRCYELIQRTNQLTLAGRRYTREQFAELIAPAAVDAYGIRCKDRFGDYGIVGVVITRQGGGELSVEEFVMSCRVAKKQCEYSVVDALASRAQDCGLNKITTRLVRTGRNMALVSAFDEMPFDKKEVGGCDAFDYVLNLNVGGRPESVNTVVFI